MASSNYNIHDNKWSLATTLGTASLFVASFGAGQRAQALQYYGDSNPPAPAGDTDRQAETSEFIKTDSYVAARDLHDVVSKWNTENQLYVTGDVGLTSEALHNLAGVLKQHPNWTVYLIERSEGMHYKDADGLNYYNHQAVEHALGKEIRNKFEFRELRSSDSGEQNGNILYISFDTNKNFRKVGYLASQAYDSQRLGESHWKGNLDQLAITPLKDGRRVFDSVMDTINHIDQKRSDHYQSKVEWDKSWSTRKEAVQNNLGNILGGTGAIIALAAGSIYSLRRISKINGLKDEVKSYLEIYKRHIGSFDNLNDSFIKLLALSGVKNPTGDTKKIIEDIKHYLKSGAELSENGLSAAKKLEHTIDPIGSRKKMLLFGSRNTTNTVEVFLKGTQQSDSLVRLASQVKGHLKITVEFVKELQSALLEPDKIKSKIESKLDSLQNYSKIKRLGDSVALNTGKLQDSWDSLKNENAGNDPLAYYRNLKQLNEQIGEQNSKAKILDEKYSSLLATLSSAEEKLKASTIKIKELSKSVNGSAENLDKLAKSNKEQRRQMLEIKRPILYVNDDSWLANWAYYNTLFQAINNNHSKTSSAYVSSGGTYHDSKPHQSSYSSRSSSSYISSSSSHSYGDSGFSSSSFGGGGSGFSSSSW